MTNDPSIDYVDLASSDESAYLQNDTGIDLFDTTEWQRQQDAALYEMDS